MVFIELYVLCNAVDSHVIQRLRNKFSDRKFEKKKSLSSHDVTTIQRCIDSFRRQRQNSPSNIVIETDNVIHLTSRNGINKEVSLAAIAEENCAVPDNKESISTIDEISHLTHKELVLNYEKDAVPIVTDEDEFSLSVIYDYIEVTIFFDGPQVPDLKKVEVNDYRPKGKQQATIKDDEKRLVSNEQNNSDIFTGAKIVQSNCTVNTQTDIVKDDSSVDAIETSITKERITDNVAEIESIYAEDSKVANVEKISVPEDLGEEFHDKAEDVTFLQPIEVEEMRSVETGLQLDEVTNVITTDANADFEENSSIVKWSEYNAEINSEGIDIIADAIESEPSNLAEELEKPELCIIADIENVEESNDNNIATHVIVDEVATVKIPVQYVEENIISEPDLEVEENVIAVDIDVVEASIGTNLDTEIINDGAVTVEIPDASVKVDMIEIASEPDFKAEENVIAVDIDVVEASIGTNLDTEIINDGAVTVEIPDASVKVDMIEIASEPDFKVEENVIAVDIDVVEASIGTNLDTEIINDGAVTVEIPDASVKVDMIEIASEPDFKVEENVIAVDIDVVEASIGTNLDTEIFNDGAVTVEISDAFVEVDMIEVDSKSEPEVEENVLAVEVDVSAASIGTKVDTEDICVQDNNVDIAQASVEENKTVEMLKKILSEENAITVDVDIIQFEDLPVENDFEPMVEDIDSSDDEEVVAELVDDQELEYDDSFSSSGEEETQELEVNLREMTVIFEETSAENVAFDRFTDRNKMDNAILSEDEKDDIKVMIDTIDCFVEDVCSDGQEEIVPELVEKQEFALDYFTSRLNKENEDSYMEAHVETTDKEDIRNEDNEMEFVNPPQMNWENPESITAVVYCMYTQMVEVDDKIEEEADDNNDDKNVEKIGVNVNLKTSNLILTADEEIDEKCSAGVVVENIQDEKRDDVSVSNEVEIDAFIEMETGKPVLEEEIEEKIEILSDECVIVDGTAIDSNDKTAENVDDEVLPVYWMYTKMIEVEEEEDKDESDTDIGIENHFIENSYDISSSFVIDDAASIDASLDAVEDNNSALVSADVPPGVSTDDAVDDISIDVSTDIVDVITVDEQITQKRDDVEKSQNGVITNPLDVENDVVVQEVNTEAELNSVSPPIDPNYVTLEIVDDLILPVYGLYTKMIEVKEEDEEKNKPSTDVDIENLPIENSSDISIDVVEDHDFGEIPVLVSNDVHPDVSINDAFEEIPVDSSPDIPDVIIVDNQETLNRADDEISLNGVITDPLDVEKDVAVQEVTTEAELAIDISAPTAHIFSDEYDSDEVIEKIFEMYTEMNEVTTIEETTKGEIIDSTLYKDEGKVVEEDMIEPQTKIDVNTGLDLNDLNEILTINIDEEMLKEEVKNPEIEEVFDRAKIEVIVTNLDEKGPVAEESVTSVDFDAVAKDESKIIENEVENDQISSKIELITPIVVVSIAEDDLKSEIPEPPKETIEYNADGEIHIDEIDVFTTEDVIKSTLKEEYRNDSFEITVTDEIDIYESDDSAFGEDALETDESVTVVSLIDEGEQNLSSEEIDVTIHDEESEAVRTVIGEIDVAEEQELVCNGKAKLTVCLKEDVLAVNILSIDELSYINKNLEIPCLSYIIEVPSINYILSTGWIPLKAINEGGSLLKFNILPFSGSNGKIIFKVYGNEDPLENYFYGTFNVNLNPFGDIDNAVVSYTKQIMGLKHEFSEIYV